MLTKRKWRGKGGSHYQLPPQVQKRVVEEGFPDSCSVGVHECRLMMSPRASCSVPILTALLCAQT